MAVRIEYLFVEQTDDMMSMRRILETAKDLVELDLPIWTPREKPTSNSVGSRLLETNPVHLGSLTGVICPRSLESASGMAQMLEIDGDKTLLCGTADSLVLWKVIGFKAALIHLAPQSSQGGKLWRFWWRKQGDR